MQQHTNRNSWKPILSGSLAAQAWELIHTLPPLILNHDTQWSFGPERSYPYSLAYGDSGKSLFWAYLGLATGNSIYEESARDYLARACTAIQSDLPSQGLFRGPSGLHWLLNHYDHMQTAGQIDVAAAITDGMFVSEVPQENDQKEMGLFYGLAGKLLAVVEAVECDPSQSERLLRDISERCDRRPEGSAWKLNGEYKDTLQRRHRGIPDDMLVTTVASGTAGVLGVLAAFLAVNPHHASCWELTYSTAKCLLSVAIPDADVTQRVFPILVGGKTPRLDAFGWASGDLGIVSSLHLATKVFQERTFEEQAAGLARKICDPLRVNAEIARCAEYNLVSGSAGRAHLCNRLYQYTGDGVFLEAAQRWYQHTLNIFSQVTDVGSPKTIPPCVGLILGAAGLGLALLAAVTETEPCWDRLMLASSRAVQNPEHAD